MAMRKLETTSGVRARRGAPVCVGIAALLLTGCAVGPDFRKPVAPDVQAYDSGTLPARTATAPVAGGSTQRFQEGADIPGDWWTLFHSSPLNALIVNALKNNPDLAAARAALTAAHENALAQRGEYYPSVSAEFSTSRNKQSTLLAPAPNFPAVPQEFLYSLFTPQLNISYVPDVFGLNRRSVESLQAQARAARFQLIAAHIALSANVVTAVVGAASLREQVKATEQLVDIEAQSVKLLQYQYDKGYASRLDLAAQESQLAQTQAGLPPLRKQLEQQQHLISVLAGEFPAQEQTDVDLASLSLPQDLPLSLPSQLVERRPDVRQARANWHAASAQVGVAIASRLPQITLSANAGSTALEIGNVFKSGTGFWGVGLDLAAPIFEGGKLLHAERAAKAQLVQAAAQYRSTVLTAFQNVADTLSALDEDAHALQAAAAAADAAKVTLDLSQRQWQAGYASYLSLLNAEQAWQQARIALIQAQANRYADTAALYLALGGGWWHRTDLPGKDHED
ncbi:MAG: efflux transporter outer membrane subunit [Xanthomonadaceae bacterium]|nr:efflux transporter outer membrane subunit [Xanthomonadaceae bacterium]